MLTLTRRIGERIVIGNDVEVVILSTRGGRVRIGVSAPREVPVYRGELVDTIGEANRSALEGEPGSPGHDAPVLEFPEGLFGMREHRSFRLYDAPGEGPLRILVSAVDPTVQLYVADALELCPTYPVADARRAAGLGDEEEAAVAVIVRVHADRPGGTVNLAAPLVIGLTNRRGAQVILDRPGLPVAAPLPAPPAEALASSGE